MYKTLTNEMQEAVVRSRLQQVEQEHMQYALNKSVTEAWPDDSPGKDNNLKLADIQIGQAEAGMKVLQAELAKIETAAKADKKKKTAAAEA